jgi:serine/threonine protein phosphatase PrpC
MLVFGVCNMDYRSAARTHIGTVRQRNEDAVLDRAEVGLWAVADGAGGHERGDYASARIVERLAKIETDARLVEVVKARLSRVNDELRAKAAVLGPDALIGSTIVVLLIEAENACALWAGDSRLYLMRGGRLRQFTRDQSYVQDLVDGGEITPEEATGHPLSNIVTNLVGGSDELILEERHDQLEPGDILLLCSDGLSGAVSDAEIAEVLGAYPISTAADRLIECALAQGARDNVSVIVVEYAR